MTRERFEIDAVLELANQGLNNCEIARKTGIPRTTIVNWRHGRRRMNRWNISVARRDSVALMDCFIGPKR